MPFIPAPNIVQVEMRCTRNLQHIENRIMVDVFSEPNLTQMTALAQECWDWWENVYAPLLPSNITLNEVVATDMSSIDGAQRTYAPDTTTTGGVSGPFLPNEVSMCLSLRTGNRGRSARGRFYTLGIAQSQMLDDNSIDGNTSTDLVVAGNNLRVAIEGLDFAWVVVSYRSGGVVRPGGPVYFPISSVTLVDNIVDSQKKRKPGVGQ